MEVLQFAAFVAGVAVVAVVAVQQQTRDVGEHLDQRQSIQVAVSLQLVTADADVSDGVDAGQRRAAVGDRGLAGVGVTQSGQRSGRDASPAQPPSQGVTQPRGGSPQAADERSHGHQEEQPLQRHELQDHRQQPPPQQQQQQQQQQTVDLKRSCVARTSEF